MGKILNVNIYDTYDSNDRRIQHCWSSDECKLDYSVYDLWDCPEDAIISRDLFSAHEYIEAVQLGIELAKAGYTGILCTNVDKDRY